MARANHAIAYFRTGQFFSFLFGERISGIRTVLFPAYFRINTRLRLYSFFFAFVIFI